MKPFITNRDLGDEDDFEALRDRVWTCPSRSGTEEVKPVLAMLFDRRAFRRLDPEAEA